MKGMKKTSTSENWTVYHGGCNWDVPLDVWLKGLEAVREWRDNKFPGGDIRRMVITKHREVR